MIANAPIAIKLILISISIHTISSQITTPCTSSFTSSFTPCLNFITGSSNGAGSPTVECCNAVGSLISDSAQCTCLILTGSVPFNIPLINSYLAISLPSMCASQSVPLQCKSSATPLPSPGPVTFEQGLPPLPPFDGSESNSPSSGQRPPSSTQRPPSSSQQPSSSSQRPLNVIDNTAANSAMDHAQNTNLVLLSLFMLGTMLINNKIC